MNPNTLYEETSVTTQSKGRLVVMLYDGAVRFLRKAELALEDGDYQAKGMYINKAQDIILELNSVLDMQSGAEIASNLRKLYNFMRSHLNRANRECSPQMIREVIGLLNQLNQGWRAVNA